MRGLGAQVDIRKHTITIDVGTTILVHLIPQRCSGALVDIIVNPITITITLFRSTSDSVDIGRIQGSEWAFIENVARGIDIVDAVIIIVRVLLEIMTAITIPIIIVIRDPICLATRGAGINTIVESIRVIIMVFIDISTTVGIPII